MGSRSANRARQCFEAALIAPENLGEARHPLANPSDIFFWLGIAFDGLAKTRLPVIGGSVPPIKR